MPECIWCGSAENLKKRPHGITIGPSPDPAHMNQYICQRYEDCRRNILAKMSPRGRERLEGSSGGKLDSSELLPLEVELKRDDEGVLWA